MAARDREFARSTLM